MFANPAIEANAQPHIAAAVLLGLASAACYAASVVVQQRHASRQVVGDGALVLRLFRNPGFWLAPAATLVGALLHVGALALGPLSVVQPLGVSELLLALPLGAVLAGRRVSRFEWLGAAAVAVGLSAVLAVAAHDAPKGHLELAPLALALAELAVATLVVSLLALAARLRGPAVPVLRAAAAATAFADASAMARVALTGAAAFPLAMSLAALSGTVGFALAPLAYRDGGLGAPLATQILVDPLVAVALGIGLLGEPIALTAARSVLVVLGLIVTAGGISVLAPHGRAEAGQAPRPVDHPGARARRELVALAAA
jgi:drug/metabolite transporter (DMT)-like permease